MKVFSSLLCSFIEDANVSYILLPSCHSLLGVKIKTMMAHTACYTKNWQQMLKWEYSKISLILKIKTTVYAGHTYGSVISASFWLLNTWHANLFIYTEFFLKKQFKFMVYQQLNFLRSDLMPSYFMVQLLVIPF